MDYAEMVQRVRIELLQAADRKIREAAFECENGTAAGYSPKLSNKECKNEKRKAYAMRAWIPPFDDCIFVVLADHERSQGRRRDSRDVSENLLLSRLPDTTLRLILRLKWFPMTPLPPLVVLAKCADGNLPSDRAREEKNLEDIL